MASPVTGFDFVRVGKNRTSTSADQVGNDPGVAYQAPACFEGPGIASNLYAAGQVFDNLLANELHSPEHKLRRKDGVGRSSAYRLDIRI